MLLESSVMLYYLLAVVYVLSCLLLLLAGRFHEACAIRTPRLPLSELHLLAPHLARISEVAAFALSIERDVEHTVGFDEASIVMVPCFIPVLPAECGERHTSIVHVSPVQSNRTSWNRTVAAVPPSITARFFRGLSLPLNTLGTIGGDEVLGKHFQRL